MFYNISCYSVENLVFDKGSGKTKVARIAFDTCSNKIEIIEQQEFRMNYQECLDTHSQNNNLSDYCIVKGLEHTKGILKSFNNFDCNINRCIGVATAWARNAFNAKEYLNLINKELNISLKIISQQQEAMLSYQTALKNTAFKESEIAVLDFGGGSFQLTYKNEGKLHNLNGRIGGDNFRKKIVDEFNKDGHEISSANFISCHQLELISPFVETIFINSINEDSVSVKEHIKDRIIICVGSFLNISIKGFFNTNSYTIKAKEISTKLLEIVGMPHEEARINFPSIQWIEGADTNLLLFSKTISFIGGKEIYFLGSSDIVEQILLM